MTGDRPWSELTAEEQDALISEVGPGAPAEVDVPRIDAGPWGEFEDSGDHDPDDVHAEGVDAAGGEG